VKDRQADRQRDNITLCRKNDTDVADYNFDTDQPILIILAEIWLRECAIKWRFAFPPL